MKEILKVFMDYAGNGIYPFLFLLALVYLFITEKEKRIRIVLLESSLVITLLFFCPLFKTVMEKVEGAGTYYRILWLLPMSVVIACAGVRLAGRHSRIGLALLAVLCMLGGSCVYLNEHVSEARNRYHLPEEVVAICDLIMPGEGEERIWTVFPSELVHFVRQYSSRIQMVYGRDMFVSSWERVIWHPMYELMEAEVIQIEPLAGLADEYGVHYVILNRSKPTEGDPAQYGLEKIGEIGGYDVFRNTDVPIMRSEDVP